LPFNLGVVRWNSDATCIAFLEFSRIDTLAGVKRTVYNQYDSPLLPLKNWLSLQGAHLLASCKATNLDHRAAAG
jgi:oleate hydratase